MRLCIVIVVVVLYVMLVGSWMSGVVGINCLVLYVFSVFRKFV